MHCLLSILNVKRSSYNSLRVANSNYVVTHLRLKRFLFMLQNRMRKNLFDSTESCKIIFENNVFDIRVVVFERAWKSRNRMKIYFLQTTNYDENWTFKQTFRKYWNFVVKLCESSDVYRVLSCLSLCKSIFNVL